MQNTQDGQANKTVETYVEQKMGKAPDYSWQPALGLVGGNYLEDLRCYGRDGELPQWHYVTSGASRFLEDAQLADAYEMTLRLLKKEGEKEPSQWPFKMFESFVAYCQQNNIQFRVYDYINQPLEAGQKTSLAGGIFVPDSELPPTETVNGKISFLQFVPLTTEELTILEGPSNSEEEYMQKVEDLLGKLKSATNKQLVVDLLRGSVA